MSSKLSKSFAASRGSALVLAGMLVLVSGLTAAAQSGDDGSPLEGTWRAQLTVRDCGTKVALRTFPTIFAYAEGGNLTYATAGQLPSQTTTGLGVWKHMYGHTYSAMSEVFIFSAAGVWTSTHRLTRVMKLSNDANTYTDTIGLEIFDTNGIQIGTGCATAVASRME
jgi:hypothetical protein